MGRKKIRKENTIQDHFKSKNPHKVIKNDAFKLNSNKRKIIFDDILLDNNKIENITFSDIRRVTNKTIDFLRSTGLKQTHISAISGINQSVLSILLRDPGTKSISFNRKKYVIAKLCDYYNKVNSGTVSHDPLTAPKISMFKKNRQLNTERNIQHEDSTGMNENKNDHLINKPTVDLNNSSSDFHSNIEECVNIENKNSITEEQIEKNTSKNNINFNTKELFQTMENNKFASKRFFFVNEFFDQFSMENTTINSQSIKLEVFKDGPISSFVNFHRFGLRNLESNSHITSSKCLSKTPKLDNCIYKMLNQPFLIPLTINLRHYIRNTNIEESFNEINDSVSVIRSNPTILLSTLKSKCYKAENFVWCSSSSNELLWGYIESLCRERHLSLFLNNNGKRRAFMWLMKEIENYKNLYIEFLHVISKSKVYPANNSLFIHEINLSELHEDIAINEKFKWNISQSTFLLREHIERIVSDLGLPSELYSLLLHSSLKQVFNKMIVILKEFNRAAETSFENDSTNLQIDIISEIRDEETSSINSFGANNAELIVELVSYGKLNKWGDNADLEYDSDDNAKLFPIIEDAELKRQIENRNRFRKRK